jgi:hypothetical protein
VGAAWGIAPMRGIATSIAPYRPTQGVSPLRPSSAPLRGPPPRPRLPPASGPGSPSGHGLGSYRRSTAAVAVDTVRGIARPWPTCPQLGQGIWLDLPPRAGTARTPPFVGTHQQIKRDRNSGLEQIDQVVLHELVHSERRYFGEDPRHKSAAWARRCQELSDRLGLVATIKRPRSMRWGTTVASSDMGIPISVATATSAGCLSSRELGRWPWSLLPGEPSLRVRASTA